MRRPPQVPITVRVEAVDGRFVVAAPYSKPLVESLKSIDGRQYDRATRSWLYPATPCSAGDIARAVRNVRGQLLPDHAFATLFSAHVRALGVITGKRRANDYGTTTPNMLHQDIGLTMIDVLPGCYLSWQMGTGKSKSVVDAVCVLGMQRTLIVCPKAVIPEWLGQFKLHGDGSAVIVPLDKSQSILNRKLADSYDELPGKVVYVVNYEALWRKALAEFVMARTWSLVVADEAQKIKEASSRVTKFLLELAKRSEKRVALSGTPISNVPTDLYSQMLFVDPGLFGTSFVAFRSRYCVFGGFKKEFERKCGCTRENAGIPNPDCPACGGNGTYLEKQAVNVVGYKNLGYMANRLFFICHRITKAEALDLPSEVDQEISVEIGKEARKIYEDLDSSFVAKVRSGEITVANALTELLRLQQLLGGDAVLDDGTHEVIDRGKADALKSVLETLSAGDNPEPVVVFCRFRHDLDAVHEVAAELSMGSAELSGRRKETEYWKAAGPECTVLATQISAGGLGVNLVRSCYAIYYSLGFSMGSYLQARSRLHRKGQTRSVTNIHLIVRRWFAEPTVDEKVFASIRRKIKYADEVLKDDTSIIGDIVSGIASTPAKTAERS